MSSDPPDEAEGFEPDLSSDPASSLGEASTGTFDTSEGETDKENEVPPALPAKKQAQASKVSFQYCQHCIAHVVL